MSNQPHLSELLVFSDSLQNLFLLDVSLSDALDARPKTQHLLLRNNPNGSGAARLDLEVIAPNEEGSSPPPVPGRGREEAVTAAASGWQHI